MPEFTYADDTEDTGPVVVNLRVFNLADDSHEVQSFRCKSIISPKQALSMSATNVDTVGLDTVVSFWRTLLTKEDGERMAAIIDSDDVGVDMRELNAAFKWAMTQHGMDVEEVKAGDPPTPAA